MTLVKSAIILLTAGANGFLSNNVKLSNKLFWPVHLASTDEKQVANAMEGVILFSLAKLLKFFHSFELNVQLRRLIFILFIFSGSIYNGRRGESGRFGILFFQY